MSTVLVTGATGFLGRQIHRHLVRQGHDVRAVVRTGTATRLVARVADVVETDDLFAEGSNWWEKTCDGADAVIHSAWYVKHGAYLDAPENAGCVTSAFAMAEGAMRAGVSHVIGVGTCMEYRLPGERLDIASPVEPSNFYSACKLSTWHMLREWFAGRETIFSWCRVFYLYGEGEDPHRLAAYIHGQIEDGEIARLSAGTQLRDFLDVRTAGAMIASVVDSRQPGAINICSGEAITIRAFAERIADAYGRRDLLEFGTREPHPSDPSAVVGICNLEGAATLLESLNESTAEAEN